MELHDQASGAIIIFSEVPLDLITTLVKQYDDHCACTFWPIRLRPQRVATRHLAHRRTGIAHEASRVDAVDGSAVFHAGLHQWSQGCFFISCYHMTSLSTTSPVNSALIEIQYDLEQTGKNMEIPHR